MNDNNNDISSEVNESSASYIGFGHVPENAQPDFEKAEMDQLKASLKRSYTDRFLVMTRLMKRSIMIRNAKITHKR